VCQSSRWQEENVAKVVGGTSSEGFLVMWPWLERADLWNGSTVGQRLYCIRKKAKDAAPKIYRNIGVFIFYRHMAASVNAFVFAGWC